MFHVYILYNSEIDKYYIGYTSDLKSRIKEHNKPFHKTKYTRKQGGIWRLIYQEENKTKLEAIRREKEIKSWKSKIRIKEMVEQSR